MKYVKFNIKFIIMILLIFILINIFFYNSFKLIEPNETTDKLNNISKKWNEKVNKQIIAAEPPPINTKKKKQI